MTRRALPFAFLLPFGSVLLWTCLVAAPTTLMYVNLQRSAHGAKAVRLRFGDFSAVIGRERFLPWALQAATASDYKILESANLPGTFPEALASHVMHTWPASWPPFGLSVHTWRAATFPFYCLPFWWMAGIGADDLLRRRRLGWPMRLIGVGLWALTAFLFVGFCFAMSEGERGSLTYPLWGFALWSFLLAVFPVKLFRILEETRTSRLEKATASPSS